MDKDLLVVGGGINGAGIAADAAGRGLSVVLCEMGDLSSGTSSASSKLIHGGLRYLENSEFGLVRESLRERKILSHLAPHLVKPHSFIMPHSSMVRPLWMLRSGLWLYDKLAFDSHIPKSKILKPNVVHQLDLKLQYTKAIQYYDCTADDSRLVLHVALLAKQHGAEILTNTKLVKAIRKDHGWMVSLLQNNDLKVMHVKAIVNATGPWVKHVASEVLDLTPKYDLRLVKGSHIIVPKLYNHDHAFVLQNEDHRIVFVIPYMNDFTLIGTTDVLLDDIEHPITPLTSEINYLCDVVNKYLQHSISPQNVVHSYAGIRALHALNTETIEARKITRDYVLDIDDKNIHAPSISVFGGKITTYRSLAENLVNHLKKYFPNLGKPWTTRAYLPGGYFPNNDLEAFKKHVFKTYAPLPENLLNHYIDTYGTRCSEVLINSHNIADLGQHYGGNLYKREVDFLVQNEWAKSAEDILWRRGKQGLFLTQQQIINLENYLTSIL